MCEILICVKDRSNSGNLVWDSKMPKQGDVVTVQADGWAWGTAELGQTVQGNPNGNHPFFRVVKLPNVTVSQASVMMAPEVDVDPQKPSPYLQYRAFFLDRSKIPVGAFRTHWDDDARAQGFITLNLTAAQLAAFKTQRTPVPF